MPRRIPFRYRIASLVVLAAIALVIVTAVTLVLGRQSERELSGIETRYVPLIELDRDLKATFAQLQRALEDAAAAAEDSKLTDADSLRDVFLRTLSAGDRSIVDNGGDPKALAAELDLYYSRGRAVSLAIVKGVPVDQLGTRIDEMNRARQGFTTHLDLATTPDRHRLADAFAGARSSQRTALRIDIIVAISALVVMALLSWRIIRRTVRSLRAVSQGVERLALGDFAQEISVSSTDEIGDLAHEANRTAVRLREYREQAEQQSWIKSGIAGLADEIAGELDLATLGRRSLAYLATCVGAEAGVIYNADHEGDFRVLEHYGLEAERAPFRIGETARGEAARDREIRVVATSVIVPLTYDGRAIGVLELRMKSTPDARVLELLSRARIAVGIAFHVEESRRRTQALLAESRRQAAAAESANKELETFSYSVSHDLRAPLRSIDGFSVALLEDCSDQLSADGQDYLHRIRGSVRRMSELIDDLLMLSRVSRGEFRRRRVDLAVMASEIIADLRRIDPDRHVGVTIQSNVVASADPKLVRIVLENLLGNAWKFTSKVSEASIELGSEEPGVYFVRDNGAGFDMQYAANLFGAFQRLHADKEFPGTGIGLATVSRIVSRHGGRIWVDAAIGRGATFRFTLPDEAS